MIKPTIGRVVWFTPPRHVSVEQDQKFAAIVAYVHSDRRVNLAVFDSNGQSFGRHSVQLLQDDDDAPEAGDYAEWMPFQIGQAKKAEAST